MKHRHLVLGCRWYVWSDSNYYLQSYSPFFSFKRSFTVFGLTSFFGFSSFIPSPVLSAFFVLSLAILDQYLAATSDEVYP